jgi:hypothetical protein
LDKNSACARIRGSNIWGIRSKGGDYYSNPKLVEVMVKGGPDGLNWSAAGSVALTGLAALQSPAASFLVALPRSVRSMKSRRK